MTFNKLFILVLIFSSCQRGLIKKYPLIKDHKLPLDCERFSSKDLVKLNNSPLFKYDSLELSEWKKNITKPIKGVVLIAHGLNLRPSKMRGLVQFLELDGFDTLRMSLTGHKGSHKEGLLVTRKSWLSEFQTHYCLTYNWAKKNKVPHFFLGYSIGALLGLDFLNNQISYSFDKMVLLAPPLKLKWYAKIPAKLGFIDKKLTIPSKNLPTYRSQKGTSVAAYKAMQESLDSLGNLQNKGLNVPTLLFIDPLDEVIHFDKLEEKIESTFESWKIVKIEKKKPTLNKSFHHLIIDRENLGQSQWERLKRKTLEHFNKTSHLEVY